MARTLGTTSVAPLSAAVDNASIATALVSTTTYVGCTRPMTAVSSSGSVIFTTSASSAASWAGAPA